ncbi:MAG: hypothetical protein ACYCW6_13045 [Candidatus Xenobia bacterium]
MRVLSIAGSAPSPTSQRAAADALIHGSPEATQYLEDILSVFPTSTLQHLQQHGLVINVTQGDGPEVNSHGLAKLGEYNLLTRHIDMDESVLMSDHGKTTVLHEVSHAIDHMRGLRAGYHSPLSEHDGQLRGIFDRWQAMDAVQDACDYADRLSTHGDAVGAQIDDGWGLRNVTYQHVNHQEVVTIDDKSRHPGLMCGVLGGAGLLAGLATGNPILAGAGAALGAFGLLRLGLHAAAPTKHYDVPLASGGTAEVARKNGHTVVEMPEGSQARTSIFSAYPHRTGKVGEFFAEGCAWYLTSPQKRAELQRDDPEMYRYVNQTFQDEFSR